MLGFAVLGAAGALLTEHAAVVFADPLRFGLAAFCGGEQVALTVEILDEGVGAIPFGALFGREVALGVLEELLVGFPGLQPLLVDLLDARDQFDFFHCASLLMVVDS